MCGVAARLSTAGHFAIAIERLGRFVDSIRLAARGLTHACSSTSAAPTMAGLGAEVPRVGGGTVRCYCRSVTRREVVRAPHWSVGMLVTRWLAPLAQPFA
jgi:hypothetical protein